MKQILISFFTILCLLSGSLLPALENSNGTMTSGSFGIAWLNSDGFLRVYDGKTVPDSVPSLKTYAIAAGDLFEEGEDQLIYIDDARKSLNVYNFKTKEKIGPFGHNVRAIALGRCSNEDELLSVFASTFSGDAYRWTKEIMNQAWIGVPGEFSLASAGKFSSRGELDDFAVVNAGALYIYSSKWQTYSKGTDEREITGLFVGNFTASPGDEIVVFDKTGNLFLYQNKSLEDLGRKTICMAKGKNEGALDTLYVLNPEGKIAGYDRETKTWQELGGETNAGFTSIVTKSDAKTGKHALFAVSEGNLYRIEGTNAEKLSDEKPTKIALKTDGKAVAEYRFGNVPFKPYIETLRTPAGRNILRDAPWDHLHHHGLMFAISADGCDFWGEFNEQHGTQATIDIQTKDASLKSEIDWNAPGAKNILRETREIEVHQEKDVTLLDWQTILKSEKKVDLTGGHYYGLGLRFDASMDKEGRFFNNTGKEGEIFRGDERLTPCRWMAYTAKLDNRPITVAVFDHPSNHIRMTAFTMGDTGNSFAYLGAALDLHRVPAVLDADEPISFRYRIAVWEGEVSPETVEETYKNYIR